MKVLVIHQDEGCPSEIHGIVLVKDDVEEAKARQACDEWFEENPAKTLSAWLAERGFTVPDLDEVFLYA
jgi:hypothetical protein